MRVVTRVPVVFLPGLLCDRDLWRGVTDALGDRVQPVYADLTRHDSVEALARDVLASAPDRFSLVGLSMGGYVAFEIMRQAMERVQRLFLFDTTARPDPPEQKERRRLLMAMARQGKFRGVTPRLLPNLIHPGRLQDEALAGTVMAMAQRVGRDAFLRQQTAIMNRPDSRPWLARIAVPTQVAVGRQDALTAPEIVKEIADGIPGATLTVIETCGHLPPLEQPAAAATLLARWLDR